MLRRFLHIYWRFARGLTVGVRGIVLDGEGRVLLVRHGYAAGWHFPGGGVEPGETLIDALARELREEGNVEITGAPRLHGVFHNRSGSRRDHIAVYVVREFRWKGPPPSSFEIPEAAFFPLDRLPDGTTAGTRARLAEVLHGQPVGEHW